MKNNILQSPLTYTLILDLSIIPLLIISAFIIGDTILPGILTRYISPLWLYGAMCIMIVFLTYIAKRQKITFSSSSQNLFLRLCAYCFFLTFTIIACFRFGILYGSVMIIFAFMLFFVTESILIDTLKST